MISMTEHDLGVTGGVDTHAETHHAAVIDALGRVLGSREFRADERGYRQLLGWMRSFGRLEMVGMEAPAPTASACVDSSSARR